MKWTKHCIFKGILQDNGGQWLILRTTRRAGIEEHWTQALWIRESAKGMNTNVHVHASMRIDLYASMHILSLCLYFERQTSQHDACKTFKTFN